MKKFVILILIASLGIMLSNVGFSGTYEVNIFGYVTYDMMVCATEEKSSISEIGIEKAQEISKECRKSAGLRPNKEITRSNEIWQIIRDRTEACHIDGVNYDIDTYKKCMMEVGRWAKGL